MGMKTAKNQVLPAPPSLTDSIRAGFDAVAGHVGLIAIPIVFDLFLWLGPHLSLERLLKGFLERVFSLQGMDAPEMTEVMDYAQGIWVIVAERLNLFSFLRSYPVGVPSLMAANQPVLTPLGAPDFWDVQSMVAVMGLIILLTLAGLAIGSFFFIIVEQASLYGEIRWREAFNRWPGTLTQVLLLMLFWMLIIFAISIPSSCFITAFSLGGFAVGQIGIFILGGLILWLLFPLFFSGHGIFVYQIKMWESVRKSIRLTRMTLPKTALFFLIILLVSEVLDILWSTPKDDSWLILVGIAGHALVTTGMLAASFVYYRDADRWVDWVQRQAVLTSSTN
jgi:hypothetical protein